MFAYELEGLRRLNIQDIKWGSSYRVKVRGRTGKMVYVSNVSRPINQRLVAKQYNVSTETLEKHLSPDYKADPKYRFYNGNYMESHLYEGVEATDFYDKLENYWKVRILNTVKLDEAEGRQHSGRDRSGCWKPLEGKNEDSKVID
ncbi:unnamed protein product [Phytophthora lilii]|uniref:Unnamed protein product n=1 Tax=Phytophthora lilii TaxID=2077276 RepID=A0A9W6XI56_9STRA|nr:unnamed protein product [Phytophthora lilii]